MISNGLSLASQLPDIQWGNISIREPELLIEDRLEVSLGDHAVLVWHPGVGHSSGDLIVWDASRRMLYAGDLLMSGVTPFFLSGSPLAAISTMRKLLELRPQVVVPGHGPPGGVELIINNLVYVESVLTQAMSLSSRSVELNDLRAVADMQIIRNWTVPERHIVNLYAALVDIDPVQYGKVVNHQTAMTLLGPMNIHPSLLKYGRRV
jgi:cyclase